MNEESNETLELGDDFDFNNFQVVRREFFAHTAEPAVSFNQCKFYVNSACLTKFPDTDYIQVLINRQSQVMALRPSQEGERDSFAWCSLSKGRRKPKQTTCRFFFAQVVAMMGWDPNYRYKIMGRRAHANGEYLLIFDLTATEIYQKTSAQGEKRKTSRTPVFPESWKDQFGLPFREHRQSMQINIFDGYAVYAVKNGQAAGTDKNSSAEQGSDCHEE